MANVINYSDYLAIATNYASARDAVLSSSDFLLAAVNDIVALDVIEPEVDLLSEFFQSYQINADLFGSSTNLLSAVRRINNHVLNRGGESLNTYIAAGIAANGGGDTEKVPQTWADLCSAAGYEIDSANIRPV